MGPEPLGGTSYTPREPCTTRHDGRTAREDAGDDEDARATDGVAAPVSRGDRATDDAATSVSQRAGPSHAASRGCAGDRGSQQTPGQTAVTAGSVTYHITTTYIDDVLVGVVESID